MPPSLIAATMSSKDTAAPGLLAAHPLLPGAIAPGRVLRESFDAPENLPKETSCQVDLGGPAPQPTRDRDDSGLRIHRRCRSISTLTAGGLLVGVPAAIAFNAVLDRFIQGLTGFGDQ